MEIGENRKGAKLAKKGKIFEPRICQGAPGRSRSKRRKESESFILPVFSGLIGFGGDG